MEPKFQSSFIPKGPLVSSTADALAGRESKKKKKGLLAFLASIIFIISIVLAGGVFGYKFYLKYIIDKMGVDLDNARATLQPETIRKLTRLDSRIISTEELISKHRVLTPLFEFLETSTPVTVRFRDFSYSMTEQGLELRMRGEARGYAALALQADIFSKSEYFRDPIFSDLTLNDKGEVVFSFEAILESSLLSYERELERMDTSSIILLPDLEEQATSTSTEPEDGLSTSTQETQN